MAPEGAHDIDKHGMLTVTGAMVRAFNFTFPPLKHEVELTQQMRRDPGPLQQDVVVGRAVFAGVTDWPFTARDVNVQLHTDVAFDHGTPATGTWVVLGTLVDVANRTERILRRIAEDSFKTEL